MRRRVIGFGIMLTLLLTFWGDNGIFWKAENQTEVMAATGIKRKSDIKIENYENYGDYLWALKKNSFLELSDFYSDRFDEDCYQYLNYLDKSDSVKYPSNSIRDYLISSEHEEINDVKLTQKEKSKRMVEIKQASATEAAKVDQLIRQGKRVSLKIKGNKKQTLKKVQQLEQKIQHVNKCSVVAMVEYEGRWEGYDYYIVSEQNTRLYMYSIQFVSKIFDKVKSECDYLRQTDFDFCDLSELAQVGVVYRSKVFAHNLHYVSLKEAKTYVRPDGIGFFDTAYSEKSNPVRDNRDDPDKIMKLLCQGKAYGSKWERIDVEMLTWRQLGISSVGNETFECTIVCPESRHGKEVVLPFGNVLFYSTHDYGTLTYVNSWLPHRLKIDPKELEELVYILYAE